MSMITEQVKFLRIQGVLCKLSGAFNDGKLLYDAADTIEQLAAKVREDNVYQKAFEDIRAEIKALSIMDYEDMYADFNDCKKAVLEIIDKHDPSKVGKENNDL